MLEDTSVTLRMISLHKKCGLLNDMYMIFKQPCFSKRGGINDLFKF